MATSPLAFQATSFNFTEEPSSRSPAATSYASTAAPLTGMSHQNMALLDAVKYPSIVAYYVFFVFCICLHILLLNLLVGLAVDDIGKIMDASKGRRLSKQVNQTRKTEKRQV